MGALGHHVLARVSGGDISMSGGRQHAGGEEQRWRVAWWCFGALVSSYERSEHTASAVCGKRLSRRWQKPLPLSLKRQKTLPPGIEPGSPPNCFVYFASFAGGTCQHVFMTGRYTNRYTTRDHWAIVLDWRSSLAALSKFGILLQLTFLGPYRQLDDRTAHHARPTQNMQQLLRAQYHLDVKLKPTTANMLRCGKCNETQRRARRHAAQHSICVKLV